jgi:hypothetical protein
MIWGDVSDTKKIYVDGSVDTNTQTMAGPIVWGGSWINSFIATGWNVSSGGNFNGIIDEVRVLSAALSSGWILTEYNNQNSPSSFYSVGSEEEAGWVAGIPIGVTSPGKIISVDITDVGKFLGV